MNCFSCRAELDDFLDATLSASQREKVAAHLQICAECSAQLALLQGDRRLARVALAELVAVPAPPTLRLRVRAALQDERAAKIARPAWWQRLGLASKSRSVVWSGPLIFATLALVILARPFARQPLSLPDSASSDSASTAMAPAQSASDAPAAAPPASTRKAVRSTSGAPKKSGETATPAAKPIPPKPVAKASAARSDSRAKPSMRERGIAPRLTPPLPLPVQNSVPLPAVPLPKRASNPVAAMKMPALPGFNAARPDAAPPVTNQARSASRSAEDAAPASQSAASEKAASQNAAKPALPPLQNRAARVVTRNAAPSTNGALDSQIKVQSPTANSNLRAENPLFAVKISPADANDALSDGSSGSRIAAMKSRPAPGANSAAARAAAPQMAAPQTFRNTAPPAPDAQVPNAQASAPQLSAGNSGFGGGGVRSRAGGFAGGRGGAANREATGAAQQMEVPALAPQIPALAIETRQWTLEITAPRDVTGAQVRLTLPPTLRFAAGDGAASRVVWSGDLVARRAVKIGFALSGGRGDEKISVVVEQNGAAGQSKQLETLEVALRAPK